MTFRKSSNTDLASTAFHLLTLAVIGLFTAGAALHFAAQLA